jgi:hypothetical protein
MAVRASMADLIAKVRVLIADPAGASEQFTDQDIQDQLDEGPRRRDVYHLRLTSQYTLVYGGTISYLDYWTDGGYWEQDAILQDGTYATLVPSTSDYLTGHWHFNASQTPPVYLTGKQYDPYGTAADLLESWMATVKQDIDFLSMGRTFKGSQQSTMIENLVKRYRRRQWVGSSLQVRTDEWPDYPVW